MQALESCVSAGVSIDAAVHDEFDEEVRYIPDKELIELKQQLDDMGGPPKQK